MPDANRSGKKDSFWERLPKILAAIAAIITAIATLLASLEAIGVIDLIKSEDEVAGDVETPIPPPTSEPGAPEGCFTEYQPLPDCGTSRLAVGDTAFVSLEGGRNGIRSSPDNSLDNITAFAEVGEELTILIGPVCSNGWLMWRVETEEGERGWTPEGDGEEYWLLPEAPACE